jgi:hypothetical protein
VRTLNLARNPTSAARSFLELYHAVVYYVLGWDASAKRPLTAVCDKQPATDRGGLLGLVRAWTACIETQARGSLHMHILVWAAGHDNLTRRFTAAHARKLFVARPPQCLPLIDAAEHFPPAPLALDGRMFGVHVQQRTFVTGDAPPSSAAGPPASVGDHLDHKHSAPPAGAAQSSAASDTVSDCSLVFARGFISTDCNCFMQSNPAPSQASASASTPSAVASADGCSLPSRVPLPAAQPDVLQMSVEMENVFDATLTADLAVRHPVALQYAAAHGKANGATDTQLQILAQGERCTNVLQGKVCGGALYAPAKRLAKLRSAQPRAAQLL